MNSTEKEKRKHAIADWTLTSAFVILMIAAIFTMKGFMTSNRELFLSAVIALVAIFAYGKITLAKWGKRL